MTAPARIRVLIAEDNRTDAELNLRELKRAGLAVEHRIVDTEREFARELGEFAPDVILSDFSMPHFDGMAALALAHQAAPGPLHLRLGHHRRGVRDPRAEERRHRLRAEDQSDRLPATVERALQDARDRRAHRTAEREGAGTARTPAGGLRTLPDVVWSISLPEERLVFMSPAARVVFGRAPEEFAADIELGFRVVHTEDRERVPACLGRAEGRQAL